jgi:hypothetical protein
LFILRRVNCQLAGFLDDEQIYKPDFLLSAEPWSKVYNIVAAEVNSPSGTTVGDIIDFTKLGIEMKIMLDTIIINNPEIIDPITLRILFAGKLDFRKSALYLVLLLTKINQELSSKNL